MKLLTECMRWRIANLLDRLPGQCWADLVCWATKLDDRKLPWSPITPVCHQGVERNGACYCNKIRKGQT